MWRSINSVNSIFILFSQRRGLAGNGAIVAGGIRVHFSGASLSLDGKLSVARRIRRGIERQHHCLRCADPGEW